MKKLSQKVSDEFIPEGIGILAGAPNSAGADFRDEESIIVVQEWHKHPRDIRSIPGIAHDPATGKHFYTLGRLKVFVE